ncbi:hypothetical protein METBIDRAFT_31484 [Metschnikowia bicuspidata var. bicuspidata NRRL YB-4993]|uniref:RRM domain-containing protein n=1 Tax=Metschnikowia bicuspidata var. bicuspidata NRRL YB-4993 TaxID=869754 RepID=A0A1A0HEQ8_9ASCO|nr:hypothetical protein METBIDRAFT_31484 [Metschnikowia bicuspidata var. bicuspidata NRRL YB-4993]OBA22609.1 hypothetical protein METBIDRAFT_31484 [Metschnikowia bicuspidata var. bicuspidata NRRL YB-4993]
MPLSRKRQRLLKKGKLDLAKIARKHPAPRPLAEDGTEQEPVSKKSPFGVWIGNLSFETTRDDIVRYIVAKTKANTDVDTPPIEEKDISRVNLPKKGDKIKGFAYVDVPSAAHVASVVALSELNLNGRNLLIKNASSFEGRPEDHGKKPLLKNPPLRILFVGNLSFDTTQELLEEHFRHCGEIVKIRMATFEDSGKCKGFAFVDFLREEGATTALKLKLARLFINRPLRLEYGEDRSKRAPKRAGHDRVVEGELDDGAPVNAAYRERRETRDVGEKEEGGDRKERQARPERPAPRPQKRAPERTFEPSAKRMKSSVALATAQRASAAIVPSQGKKKTFD